MKDLFEFNYDFFSFPMKIKVMTFQNRSELEDYFDLVEIYNSSASFHIKDGEMYVALNENNYDRPREYVHEFLHAVKHYLNHLGINDEETECYMLGYLVQTYTDFLEIHKQKIEEFKDEFIT